MVTQCIFCSIIEGTIPSHTVYEDEHVVAFLDITPINQGHTLVVPKQHARNIFDMSKDSWRHVTEAVHHLAPIIQKATNADGLTISMNNEPPAGQSVFHPHVHLIPRFSNDGHASWRGTTYPKGKNEDVAKRIRDLL